MSNEQKDLGLDKKSIVMDVSDDTIDAGGSERVVSKPARFLDVNTLEAVMTFLDGNSLRNLLSVSTLYHQDHPIAWREVVLNQIGALPHLKELPIAERDWEAQAHAWDMRKFKWLRIPCGASPAPEPRYLHRVAVDDDGCAWVFGGWGDPMLLNDLWKLDLNTPTLQWEQVECGYPAPRPVDHRGGGGELEFGMNHVPGNEQVCSGYGCFACQRRCSCR